VEIGHAAVRLKQSIKRLSSFMKDSDWENKYRNREIIYFLKNTLLQVNLIRIYQKERIKKLRVKNIEFVSDF
jgi:hypothetical protein